MPPGGKRVLLESIINTCDLHKLYLMIFFYYYYVADILTSSFYLLGTDAELRKQKKNFTRTKIKELRPKRQCLETVVRLKYKSYHKKVHSVHTFMVK